MGSRPRRTTPPKSSNRLWIARKQAGYPQKWVSRLLRRAPSVISEYESGRKLPTLSTALKLEYIYQTPLAELFPELHSQLVREVAQVKERMLGIQGRDRETEAARRR